MSAESLSGDCDVVTRFCDCLIMRDGKLVQDDLFVRNGVFVDPEKLFYEELRRETVRIDTKGCIIAPGFIDVQINGALGFDFSSIPNDSRESEDEYVANVHRVSAYLLHHGVTSFCPTLVSSTASCYAKLLPLLRRAKQEQTEHQIEQYGSPSFNAALLEFTPLDGARTVDFGAQIIGVHLEGPFINRDKKGAHDESVLRTAQNTADFEAVYGGNYLDGNLVRIITLAPELIGRDRDGTSTSTSTVTSECKQTIGNYCAGKVISDLVARGIRVSIGHSNATYDDGELAVRAGATFVTHLFNCTHLFHHREPALLGLLTSETRSCSASASALEPAFKSDANGKSEKLNQADLSDNTNEIKEAFNGCDLHNCSLEKAPQSDNNTTMRLYFGVIADGVHTHHAALRLAHSAHPDGLVLVTDAMAALGLNESAAPFKIGSRVVEVVDGAPYIGGSNKAVLSGARVSMDECVRNYIRLASATQADAILAASSRPARLLGLQQKGSLEPGTHADFVILDKDMNILATYIRGRSVYTRETVSTL